MAQARQAASGTSATTTCVVAFASNNLAGSLLFLGADDGSGVFATGVTDSQGNTWTKIASTLFNFSSWSAETWSAPNSKAGANTVTATYPAGAHSLRALIAEYAGVVAAPLDVNTFAISGNGSGATSADSGASPTTTQGNEILVGFIAQANGSSTITAGTNYAIAVSGGANSIEDRAVSVTGAYHALFSMGTGGDYACFVATFKQAVIPTPISPGVFW